MPTEPNVTKLMHEAIRGNDKAREAFCSLVQRELRSVAAAHLARERAGHTLAPTALVNEVYLRMFAGDAFSAKDRQHFFAMAARQMKFILTDSARGRNAGKRKSGVRIDFDLAKSFLASPAPPMEVEDLGEALDALRGDHPRAAEVVELKFFGGFTDVEVAEQLGVSKPTVRRDWVFARTWLFRHLSGPRPQTDR